MPRRHPPEVALLGRGARGRHAERQAVQPMLRRDAQPRRPRRRDAGPGGAAGRSVLLHRAQGEGPPRVRRQLGAVRGVPRLAPLGVRSLQGRGHARGHGVVLRGLPQEPPPLPPGRACRPGRRGFAAHRAVEGAGGVRGDRAHGRGRHRVAGDRARGLVRREGGEGERVGEGAYGSAGADARRRHRVPRRVPVPLQVRARLPAAEGARRVLLRHVRAGVRLRVPPAQHQPRVHLIPRLGALLPVGARAQADAGVPRDTGGLPPTRQVARVHARAHLGVAAQAGRRLHLLRPPRRYGEQAHGAAQAQAVVREDAGRGQGARGGRRLPGHARGVQGPRERVRDPALLGRPLGRVHPQQAQGGEQEGGEGARPAAVVVDRGRRRGRGGRGLGGGHGRWPKGAQGGEAVVDERHGRGAHRGDEVHAQPLHRGHAARRAPGHLVQRVQAAHPGRAHPRPRPDHEQRPGRLARLLPREVPGVPLAVQRAAQRAALDDDAAVLPAQQAQGQASARRQATRRAQRRGRRQPLRAGARAALAHAQDRVGHGGLVAAAQARGRSHPQRDVGAAAGGALLAHPLADQPLEARHSARQVHAVQAAVHVGDGALRLHPSAQAHRRVVHQLPAQHAAKPLAASMTLIEPELTAA
mmetsp:Transcript_13457/g.35048  ORF Transcript_13457/g.35048 Transcript_13457/m.35048 type:complete len:640 (-) Transcript_13457:72-1991(-)